MRFNEIRGGGKAADQVRGPEPMPKKKRRGKHPYQGRLVGESILTEGARIEHLEDHVFKTLPPSKGADKALQSLISLEQGAHKDVTIKWDGSPAIVFGRDSDGNFILTDKSGFTAKGYNGKATSAKDLQAMLMNRPGASNPDEKKRTEYKQFASNMVDIYDEYEKATPKDFRGFFKGDLLYFNTPTLVDNEYEFTPNIVTYSVDKNSELGRKIGQSKTGIVIHREIDPEGKEGPTQNEGILEGKEVLVIPPVFASSAPDIDDTSVKELKALISKDSAAMDTLLDINTLTQIKLKKLPDVFYAYLNSKVDTGLENLGKDFLNWIQARPQLSDAAKKKIAEYVAEHQQGFNALWEVVAKIQQTKDDVIQQLDNQPGVPVKQRMSSGDETVPGGEGYVLAHDDGSMSKLVPRQTFSKFNRSKQR